MSLTYWAMGNTHNSNYYYNEEYDSTWEREEGSDHEETTEVFRPFKATYAAKDMQTFRHKYRKTLPPDYNDDYKDEEYLEDDEVLPNLNFYRNNIPFEPQGVFIDYFHNEWVGDYDKLEYVHSYIQWLFPIQEKGMNFESRELSLREIQEFRKDEEVKRRLLTSYKLMLDFYGIKLVDEETGDVERAFNWEERFKNLNRNPHNNLRITRILKCLALLGFPRYQKPLVRFFLEETLVRETLPRVKQSVLDYFMFAVVDKTERQELVRFAFDHFKQKNEFEWCPRRICNKWLKELEKGTESQNLNADSTKEVSSDLTFQNDETKKEDENKTDTNEDTSNGKYVDSKGKNDENVSGESQDPKEKASPLSAAGNANKSETNEEFEAPSSVDSDGHTNSEDQAAIQEGDDKNSDSITSSDESPSENAKETSNQSPTIEKCAQDASPSSINSGITQKYDGTHEDESKPCNLKSQHTESDSKEHESGEMKKSGSASPGDCVANSAHSDEEKSTDMNSQKYTGSVEEAKVPSSALGQTSDKDSSNSESIDTHGSDRNINCESGEISEEDQAKSGPTHQPPTTLKSPISQENMTNPLKGNEDQSQGNVMFNQLKATSEDPVHQSVVDIAEESSDENAGSAVTSLNNEYSDSKEVKNSKECKTLKNDVSSSHVTPDEDKEAGESSKEESVEEIGCVKNGDAKKHEYFNTQL
ncbi:uncharacterized protein Hap1MRO34_025527 [Clarias gariepinus]|uniref:opioid growth factor receptor-like protein 1 n=1 Tax=Clarias gariepinus TaxID=13013 RepID=UPI00234C2290|nr:opioid growth factor receptor-like protein 1 [Clarias gariepinus]